MPTRARSMWSSSPSACRAYASWLSSSFLISGVGTTPGMRRKTGSASNRPARICVDRAAVCCRSGGPRSPSISTTRVGLGAQRLQGADHQSQRSAPRGEADRRRGEVGLLQHRRHRVREVAVELGVVGADRVDDVDLAQAVALFDQLLELAVDLRTDCHHGPDDARLFGLGEQPGDARLGHLKSGRDVGLAESVRVVEPGDLQHQAQVVDVLHEFASQSARHVAEVATPPLPWLAMPPPPSPVCFSDPGVSES